jgi:HPt (histidine-containing phosphotransfer) domain-containing protein
MRPAWGHYQWFGELHTAISSSPPVPGNKDLLTRAPKKAAKMSPFAKGFIRPWRACMHSRRKKRLKWVGSEVVAASNVLTVVGPELESIDEDHLGRMTLGDRRLEREVLEVFLRQTSIMLSRIAGGEPAVAAAAAHTLLGSARGIGAWRMAQAAERLEQVASEAGEAGLDRAIAELKAAAQEASVAIGERLTHSRNRTANGC